MSIGTLVRVPVLVRKELPDQTLDTVEKEITSAEERLQQQMLECKFGQKLYFRKHNHLLDVIVVKFSYCVILVE